MGMEHLDQIARYLQEESALCFAGRRRPMLRSHLEARVASLGLRGMGDYLPLLKESAAEQAELYRLVTVNETSFFRNRQQFEDLRTRIIPRLEEEKGRRPAGQAGGRRQLRVLSAGCSTGEEPYSLAMTLLEALRYPLAWDLEILAGDLDEECLRVAARAHYPQTKVEAIPAEYRERYLRRDGEGWTVREEAAKLVRFEPLNLSRVIDGAGLPGIGADFPGFDLILCRNVMIYFPQQTQQQLIETLQRLLAPGGYLLTGDAEPLHLHRHSLQRVEDIASLIYRLPPSEDPAAKPQPPAAPLPLCGIEDLLRMVADSSLGIPARARQTLIEMGLPALAEVLEAAVRNPHAGLRNGAMEVLVAFGEAAVPLLTRLLKDPDDQVRNFCTVMLGSIGSRSAVPALITALEDTDPNVRHGAAEALGKIGDAAALQPLLKLLDQGFWLQFPAISALGVLGNAAAVPRLVELLDDELLFDPVTVALQRIADRSALPALRKVASSGDPRRARVATQAIADIEARRTSIPQPHRIRKAC